MNDLINDPYDDLSSPDIRKPQIVIDEDDQSPVIFGERKPEEDQQINMDAYLQLLQTFVQKEGMAQAFNSFLVEQKQTLIAQHKALSKSQELERVKNFNDQQQEGRNSLRVGTTSSGQSSKVQKLLEEKNRSSEGAEETEEQVRRMRAYQAFLRLQQESKNQAGFTFEEFLNMTKIPQLFESGANFITNVFDWKTTTQNTGDKPKKTQAINDSKGQIHQEESSIQLVSQTVKGDIERQTFPKNINQSEVLNIIQTPKHERESRDVNKSDYMLGQQQYQIIENAKEKDELMEKIEKDREDLTEYLGDLTLRAIQQKKDKSKRLIPIYPDSNFRSIWDLFTVLFICYQALVIPYRFCFKARAYGTIKVLETVMDVFFICDIFLNFVTGYYKKGNVIMKRGPIIRHYLRTWFIFDLIATFPYSWFVKEKSVDYWPDDGFDEVTANNDIFVKIISVFVEVNTTSALSEFDLPQILRLIKLVRFARVIKVTQFFKLRKLIYRYERFFFDDTVGTAIEFIKIFMFVFFFVHWIGCIFFLIAGFDEVSKTWISLLNKDDTKSAIDMYIASASWSFTTIASVGYGDIYPVSNSEKIFGLVAMMISTGIFSIIVGLLGTLFDKNDQIIAEYQEKIIQTSQFLVRQKIPKAFRKKVKRYLLYIIENKRQYKMEEEEVLDMLNDNLKIELIVHLNGKMLHDSPLFKYFNLSFLSELTFILKRETFTIEESIFDEDCVGDKLHYITKGNVILTHKKTATFIAEASIDTFIGEISFFTGWPRKASARSKNFTEVLTLYVSDYYEAIQKYPQQLEVFQIIQKHLNESFNDLSLLGITCYICKNVGHIAPDCQDFGLIRGNLRELWLKKMKDQNAKVKEAGPKKLKRDFSLQEDYEDNEDNDRNSLVEMFTYLEKRYKKDSSDDTAILDKKPTADDMELPEIPRFVSQGLPKLSHLSANANKAKDHFNIQPSDQIDEQSNEESVRESLRKSIESQLILVNKLTEIQLARSSEMAFTTRGDSERQRDQLDQYKNPLSVSSSQIRKKKGKKIEKIDEEEEDDAVIRPKSDSSNEEQVQSKQQRQPRLIPLYEAHRKGGQFSTFLQSSQDHSSSSKRKKEYLSPNVPLLMRASQQKDKMKDKPKKRQDSIVEQLDIELIENLLPEEETKEHKKWKKI